MISSRTARSVSALQTFMHDDVGEGRFLLVGRTDLLYVLHTSLHGMRKHRHLSREPLIPGVRSKILQTFFFNGPRQLATLKVANAAVIAAGLIQARACSRASAERFISAGQIPTIPGGQRIPVSLPSLNGSRKQQPWTASWDAYGGSHRTSERLSPNTQTQPIFRASLSASLTEWRRSSVRGVWLKLPFPSCSSFVPVASDLGFAPHHAEKDYIMMTAWLPTEVACTLPPNASHQCGVGMFVTYTAPEDGITYVLCVQERNGVLKGKNVWKMPTGLVNERGGRH